MTQKPGDKPLEVSPAPKEEKKLKVEEKVVEKTEAETLHGQIAATLAQYGGRESEIPLNHPYWTWANRYRSLGK